MALTKIKNGVTDISLRNLEAGTGETIDFNIDSITEMQLLADGTLHVEGDVIAASSTVASDINLKDNIKLIEAPLDIISKLRGVTFDWKKDGLKSAGIIAQDVESVMPELIKDAGTHLTVNYNGLVGLLVEAVKDLQYEIKQLKNQ